MKNFSIASFFWIGLIFKGSLTLAQTNRTHTPKENFQDFKKILENTNNPHMLTELKELWKAKPIFTKFLGTLTQYQGCHKNALEQNWTSWNTIPKCNGNFSPDQFRRFAIKKFENTARTVVSQFMDNQPNSKINWRYIGSQGPSSDIDTVAQCSKCNKGTPLKIVAEIWAKSLFDSLGIAVYGKSMGETFDTESYIDTTDDLKKEDYEERIKDPNYQNLAFTLAFVQVARQLSRQVKNAGLFSMTDFEPLITPDGLQSVLLDAQKVADLTKPNNDQTENIKIYLPIINRISQEISKNTDNIWKLKGILETYFPEGYYTREALAHICYSDDRYSQLLLSYLSKNSEKIISADDIDELKKNAITPNKFIYAVSALENLGYFYNKMNEKNAPLTSLKNASKYFFRITRALTGYWEVGFYYDTFIENQNGNFSSDQEKSYIKDIFKISSKLEKLKRGFLPFSSPKDIKAIFEKVNRHKYSDLENTLLAKQIYGLHIDTLQTKKQKREQLEKVAHKLGLKINSYIFESPSDSDQNSGKWELASLFNSILGQKNSDAINSSHNEISSLNESLPMWGEENSPIMLRTLNEKTLKNFLLNFTSFIIHTLNDYAKKQPHTFNSINLANDTKKFIKGENQ